MFFAEIDSSVDQQSDGCWSGIIEQLFLFSKIQDGYHISSGVSKMANQSLFLYQFSCVRYHFSDFYTLSHGQNTF